LEKSVQKIGHVRDGPFRIVISVFENLVISILVNRSQFIMQKAFNVAQILERGFKLVWQFVDPIFRTGSEPNFLRILIKFQGHVKLEATILL